MQDISNYDILNVDLIKEDIWLLMKEEAARKEVKSTDV